MAQFEKVFDGLNGRIAQVKVTVADEKKQGFAGVHCHKNGSFFTIHLLNYNYDNGEDKVLPLAGVRLTARLPEHAGAVRCVSLAGGELPCDIKKQDDRLEVFIPEMPLYAVVEVVCE